MRTSLDKTAMLLGATLLATFASSGLGNDEAEYERLYSRFYEHDNPYAEVIARSEEYFENQNIEGAILGLDEDFTMLAVTDEGVEERVRGIEQVRTAVGAVFGSGTWLGANVYKWGLTGNMLVQIEEDFYRTEDGGARSVKSLVVFEHRDGKRWREWRFKPTDR